MLILKNERVNEINILFCNVIVVLFSLLAEAELFKYYFSVFYLHKDLYVVEQFA